MFEILRAFETAKNEKNKFLRFFLIHYTRHRLKKSFFKKFDIYMTINKALLTEFVQFHNCTGALKICSNIYPSGLLNSKIIPIWISHYFIYIKVKDNEYDIEINDILKLMSVSMTMDEIKLNMHFISEIICIAIYNYCVAYIYGENSGLYKYDPKYTIMLDKLFL